MIFVPSLAACAITVTADVSLISIFIIVAPEIISYGLRIFVSVYLCYKIIKSNRFIMAYKKCIYYSRSFVILRLEDTVRDKTFWKLSALLLQHAMIAAKTILLFKNLPNSLNRDVQNLAHSQLILVVSKII